MNKQSPTNILIHDGVVVLPTDTLYGVCASALSKKAVERIYAIKGRDENKPFIILIDTIDQLKRFGIKLTKEQKTFLEHLWPNPVTVILPIASKKFAYLHRKTEALAFRIPKSPKLREFLKKTGPLVAPSANPQGEKPAETIREAKAYFGNTVNFYIAGGRKVGTPSTIIKLSHTGSYEIVRQGRFKLK
jgi:L-threonylcarbamoyladenylate synthase